MKKICRVLGVVWGHVFFLYIHRTHVNATSTTTSTNEYFIKLTSNQLMLIFVAVIGVIVVMITLVYVLISKRTMEKRLREVNDELREKNLELEAYSEELYASQEELDFHYKEVQKSKERLQEIADFEQNTSVMHHHKFMEAISSYGKCKDEVYIVYVTITNLESLSFSMGNSVYISIQQSVANEIRRELNGNEYFIGKNKGQDFMVAIRESYGVVRSFVKTMSKFFEAPLYSDYFTVHLDTKMGIACYPSDTEDIEKLPKLSTLAVVDIMRNPSKNISFFTKTILDSIEHQNLIRREIETALATSAFMLYYQPKYDIEGVKILGLEALIRWKLADGTIRSPGEFIDLAETTGQIVDIGYWVIDQCCNDIKKNRKILEGIPVAINLSAQHFKNEDIVTYLVDAVEKHEISYDMLELEITETTLIEDSLKASELLTKLTALGFKISLDDFGTGYSSINYIKDLPLHKLKVDRAFINKVFEPKYKALLASIVQLANNFGFKLIMEGVETYEQLEILKEMKPDEIQGYLFAKPTPLEDVLYKLQVEKRNK